MAFLGDVLLQDLALCRLRVAKVHDLVEQFVDDDKVVAYALLLELFEVLCQDRDELVQEGDDLGRVRVLLGQGEHWAGSCEQCTLLHKSPKRTVEVVVAYVHVIDALARQTRRHVLPFLLGIENERQELFDSTRRNVVAVRPLDERLSPVSASTRRFAFGWKGEKARLWHYAPLIASLKPSTDLALQVKYRHQRRHRSRSLRCTFLRLCEQARVARRRRSTPPGPDHPRDFDFHQLRGVIDLLIYSRQSHAEASDQQTCDRVI